MVSAEEQFQFHQATGYIPVNKTVYDLPEADKWFEENPMYKVAIDCIHASNPNVQEPFDIIDRKKETPCRSGSGHRCAHAAQAARFGQPDPI